MGVSFQHSKMVIKCNVCKKTKEVSPLEFYKPGGIRGGCCVTEDKAGVKVFCTYSAVPNGRMKTQKASRDRKGRGSMKG